MLSITGLTYGIGGRNLYEDASLFIGERSKVALVGRNGTGKSTLLRLIYRDLTPDQGRIHKAKEATIGFLTQDMLSYRSDASILEIALQAFLPLVQLKKKMDEILQAIEHHYQDELMEKLTAMQNEFEIKGGYQMESQAEKVLEGIGFTTEELFKPFNEFSGGWRMRVLLAKLLLERPSLLMLDEPTNHLDISSIQWLEGYLKKYPGAVIVISHDRRFLDQVATKTVEVAHKKLNLYHGNFSFYEKEKRHQEVIQQNAYLNQQKKIKKTEEFISRFRAKASKASLVQSRIKSLERLDRLEQVEGPSTDVKLRFYINHPSSREVVTLEGVSKNYGAHTILKNSSLQLLRGDRIAVIGANGQGKTTLLKLVAGTLQPSEGKVILGHKVEQAFYAQHQVDQLNLERTIFDEMVHTHPHRTHPEIRSTLGALLFSGDEVKKKIKVLSGGEKARVALAKVMLSGANFLILDEPTNHLDMFASDILCTALKQYQGTLMLVSHNRDFIARLANKIGYIQNHQVKIFPGDYASYEYAQKTKVS